MTQVLTLVPPNPKPLYLVVFLLFFTLYTKYWTQLTLPSIKSTTKSYLKKTLQF